jgi:thiamine-monophosphate kinase
MSRGELAFIDRLRAIATDPAARGLRDDAALLDGWVLTHDMIADGVHFLSGDPPASVGWKLVAVNLSDLAAKGATPRAALMGASLSNDEQWDDAFQAGVAAACESYGVSLIGGDTIAMPESAPRVFGLTAIGKAGIRTPARSGGRAGDRLWIGGTLGDAAAGLAQLQADAESEGPLVEAYRRPVPLLAAGRMLAEHATAMMDVSDGLLIDLARLCDASGCGAAINLDSLPLSDGFVAARGGGREARLFAATGGDDYALLLTLPDEFDPASRLRLPYGFILRPIGTLTGTMGINLSDHAGKVPLPERLGYEHHRRP